MGVLDDAIRQHLELKRAHGADESEVKRKENEALGPARRETAPPPEQEQPEASEAAPEEKVEPEAELAPEQPLEAEAVAQPEPMPEPPVFEDESVAHKDEPVEFEEPLAEEPFAEEPAPPPVADTPPRGFESVEDDPLAEPPPPAPAGADDGDEDVLEETPDFLQETPEHDRLWFEQKPPRDFDFDE